MAGWDMTWESPSGEVVELSIGNAPLQGIWVREVDGFVADVETSAELRSTGVGVQPDSRSVPEMSGTLDLVLAPETSATMLTASQMYSQVIGLFSQFRHGTMTLSQPDGQILTGRMRLASAIRVPKQNPHTSPSSIIEVSLDLVCDDGVWAGMRDVGVETASGARRIMNVGDLTGYPDVTFTHGTVAIDGADPVTLPTVATTRSLSTDPGSGYKITDPVTGQVDVDAWSSMRGRPVPGRVEPGQMVMVQTTGDVEVSLTPRFTTPWR